MDETHEKMKKEKKRPKGSLQGPKMGQLDCHWLRQAMLTFYKSKTLSAPRLAFNGKPLRYARLLCECLRAACVRVYVCVPIYQGLVCVYICRCARAGGCARRGSIVAPGEGVHLCVCLSIFCIPHSTRA
ncbi:hypothetical protein BCR43DRAFT_48367 [Syncephalastrum racemosum]|uniref:Uncharacterized protein n=1 Tax=Syncephalastrum racemosum TaxID=13706 RepID=A0A1X2HV93_SYNRA|nr:hypothetical protein BCR43DRAFT_48367 [Syncephalastrum racemosum]